MVQDPGAASSRALTFQVADICASCLATEISIESSVRDLLLGPDPGKGNVTFSQVS